MVQKKVIIKNSFVGLTSQLLAQVLQFIIRKITLRYIGVEILGISTTFASVLSTLSLAELGFQQAVIFYLYEPLQTKNSEKINRILTVLKRVYEAIGILFIVLALCLIPFLKFILKGVNVNTTIIEYYIVMSINISITYFAAYKRALLYADQKEYVSKLIDCLANIGLCILKVYILFNFRNYLLYLIIQIIQSLTSNLIINFYCATEYNYLKIVKFDLKLFKKIVNDVKNVFMAKIAGYIYGATDNLVVSSFIGTVYVGYLSNYTLFAMIIRQIVNSIFVSMTPIIGNMLTKDEKPNIRFKYFKLYSYIRYLFASALIIPLVLFLDDVVMIFFGKDYIISHSVTILISIDLYIHIVYGLCCEYINGKGFFKYDCNVSIIGAVANISFSIILVKVIGLSGVLVGTVVSQVYFWIARSYVVFDKILCTGLKHYIYYWLKNFFYVLIILLIIFIDNYINNFIFIDNDILQLIIKIIICELINLFAQYFLMNFVSEKKEFYRLLKI